LGDRSVRNWPLQSAGGDILRVACVMARRAGIEVVATAHDSVFFETDEREILDVSREMVRIMTVAGEQVAGLKLRVDPKILGPNERYFKDDRARSWWAQIWKRLGYAP
jgi:hypothetical protein